MPCLNNPLPIPTTDITIWTIFWLSCSVAICLGHISWTPINSSSDEGKVDLWTRNTTGCACTGSDVTRGSGGDEMRCACCVKDGGCSCGQDVPSRCSQCGLQQHCANMCNMTVDMELLQSASGKTFGQIKSPVFTNDSYCWYRFTGVPGYRIEVQVYRIVRTGRWSNGCVGGGLAFSAGTEFNSPSDRKYIICGENVRFSPPATFFIDQTQAILEYRSQDISERSQFMAMFSFSPQNSALVGVQQHGARAVAHTDCDVVYTDTMCSGRTSCLLTSPGHPGIYPPHTRCKYFIFMSRISSVAEIKFRFVDFPTQFCGSHRISVYAGSTVASRHLATLCGGNATTVQHWGPKLLVEFRSGVPVTPFTFGGFLATLRFTSSDDNFTSDAISESRQTSKKSPVAVRPNVLLNGATSIGESRCTRTYSSHQKRAGYFSIEGACTLSFIGRPHDVVSVALYNYWLGGPECSSFIRIREQDFYKDDSTSGNNSSDLYICSPAYRGVRDQMGRPSGSKRMISVSNWMEVLIQSTSSSLPRIYVDGAYVFHDVMRSGVLVGSEPYFCSSEVNDLNSADSGSLTLPSQTELLWGLDGPLKCRHTFYLTSRSLQLKIWTSAPSLAGRHCQTECSADRCRCRTFLVELRDVDHLRLSTADGHQLICLCGNYTRALPLTLRVNMDVVLEYQIAQFVWAALRPNLTVDYTFREPLCPPGDHPTEHDVGGVSTQFASHPDISTINPVLFYLRCHWIVKPQSIDRLLQISAKPDNVSSCSRLNVTFITDHHGSENSLLDVYCLGQGNRVIRPVQNTPYIVKLTCFSRLPVVQFWLNWTMSNAMTGDVSSGTRCVLLYIMCSFMFTLGVT